MFGVVWKFGVVCEVLLLDDIVVCLFMLVC